jgi:CheY-like chemotaxis protein
MNLTTEFRCLIVEDDKFKLDRVLSFLREQLGSNWEIVTSNASSIAMEELNKDAFDLAIIDMAIPSHPASLGDGSPYSLPKGGLDVLFEIDALGYDCVSIILTQYPEVEINGCLVPVESAIKEMQSKFDIAVAGCVEYFEDNDVWKTELLEIINKNENTFTGR